MCFLSASNLIGGGGGGDGVNDFVNGGGWYFASETDVRLFLGDDFLDDDLDADEEEEGGVQPTEPPSKSCNNLFIYSCAIRLMLGCMNSDLT